MYFCCLGCFVWPFTIQLSLASGRQGNHFYRLSHMQSHGHCTWTSWSHRTYQTSVACPLCAQRKLIRHIALLEWFSVYRSMCAKVKKSTIPQRGLSFWVRGSKMIEHFASSTSLLSARSCSQDMCQGSRSDPSRWTMGRTISYFA